MKCPDCNGCKSMEIQVGPDNLFQRAYCGTCYGFGYVRMPDPTHFIEVYTSKGASETIYSRIAVIKYLTKCVEFTEAMGNLHTVAIWKIKFK